MPRVSIGLPVYNGDRYLKGCITSLLEQTYRDFELIICDNASNDQTEQICRQFADADPRIRYYRNPTNIGAGRNYNRSFELATGELFKWAAHDDICAPAFLERCVETLDQNPRVVLVYPQMIDIDENGHSLGVRNTSHIPRATRGSVPLAHRRFRNIIRRDYTVEEIFGLIRHSALAKSVLIKNYTDSDRTLLAELGLHGPFIEIPEVLFYHRMHNEMSTKAFPGWQQRSAWFDPALKGKRVFPTWRQLAEYLGIIFRAPIGLRDRFWCFAWMANWVRQSHMLLIGDLRRGAGVEKKG